MAFRKKAGHILAYEPDILVVPECEHPDKLKFNNDIPKPTDILWFGENKNKGLGIFSYTHFRFRLIKTHNPALKMIIPIAVTGNAQHPAGNFKFTLFAVWANNPADPDGVYVEQVWKALQHYKLSKKNTILAGDFNSNTIWDRKYRIGNHSHVVVICKRKVSAAVIIFITNKYRERKNILLIIYTATRTNPIILIIVLLQPTWPIKYNR